MVDHGRPRRSSVPWIVPSRIDPRITAARREGPGADLKVADDRPLLVVVRRILPPADGTGTTLRCLSPAQRGGWSGIGSSGHRGRSSSTGETPSPSTLSSHFSPGNRTSRCDDTPAARVFASRKGHPSLQYWCVGSFHEADHDLGSSRRRATTWIPAMYDERRVKFRKNMHGRRRVLFYVNTGVHRDITGYDTQYGATGISRHGLERL